MRSRKSSPTYHSFEEIKELLRAGSISLRENHPVQQEVKKEAECEEQLFTEAMEGVKPISRENCIERVFQIDLPDAAGIGINGNVVVGYPLGGPNGPGPFRAAADDFQMPDLIFIGDS